MLLLLLPRWLLLLLRRRQRKGSVLVTGTLHGRKKLFSETLMYLVCIPLLTDLLFASDSGRVVFSCSTSMSRCRTVPGSSPPAPVPGRCPCTSTCPWACACARVLEKPDLTVCLLLLLSWGPSGRAKVAYG